MMVGPMVAGVTVLSLLRGIGEQMSLWEFLGRHPFAKAFGAATVALALVLLVFVPLYLQVRAVTKLTLSEDGVQLERERVLPFGWLARSIHHAWAELRDVSFQQRRRVLFSEPNARLDFGRDVLWIPLTQIWEESQGARPAWPRPPEGGKEWHNHPLFAAIEAFRSQSRAQ
jgi:hypothetical protein